MVSIPSPVQNYMLLWGISLGSSIGLMIVAMVVRLVVGADTDVAQLFILMFNATASSFILLTMIPVGVFILVFGVVFNALAPIIAPIGAALWNFGSEFIIGVINGLGDAFNINITFMPIQFVLAPQAGLVNVHQLTLPVINITEAIDATTQFLDSLRLFLVEDVIEGGSGSGTFGSTPSFIMAKIWG